MRTDMLHQLEGVVRRAGDIVREAHDIERATMEKHGAADLVTKYDVAVQGFLQRELLALLPEAEQKAFEATFEAAAKELLAAGVEVGYSKEVRTGFKVGAKDGGYYISFSDQDFDALLKEYLRDKVYKMLYNA
mgnify:CR=1 FL=1